MALCSEGLDSGLKPGGGKKNRAFRRQGCLGRKNHYIFFSFKGSMLGVFNGASLLGSQGAHDTRSHSITDFVN